MLVDWPEGVGIGKTLTGIGLDVCLSERVNCQALKTNAAKTMPIMAVRVASNIRVCNFEFLFSTMDTIERGAG